MWPGAYETVCTAIPVGAGIAEICGPVTGAALSTSAARVASKRASVTVASTGASPAFTITGATHANALSPGSWYRYSVDPAAFFTGPASRPHAFERNGVRVRQQILHVEQMPDLRLDEPSILDQIVVPAERVAMVADDLRECRAP